MGNRNPSPLRRAAREDLRVWPFALVLVVLYLFADQMMDFRKDAVDPALYQQRPEAEAWP